MDSNLPSSTQKKKKKKKGYQSICGLSICMCCPQVLVVRFHATFTFDDEVPVLFPSSFFFHSFFNSLHLLFLKNDDFLGVDSASIDIVLYI